MQCAEINDMHPEIVFNFKSNIIKQGQMRTQEFFMRG